MTNMGLCLCMLSNITQELYNYLVIQKSVLKFDIERVNWQAYPAKLLQIYRTRLETDNLSTKNGHFIEPFSRYKKDCHIEPKLIQKRWSIREIKPIQEGKIPFYLYELKLMFSQSNWINFIFNFKGIFSEKKRLTSLNLSGTS